MPPTHPARWRLVRRRQVSWLTGQSFWPCLPEPRWSSGPPSERWTGQRLAADSCGSSRRLAPGPPTPPGRTAFPFHPPARDHRRPTVAPRRCNWQSGEVCFLRKNQNQDFRASGEGMTVMKAERPCRLTARAVRCAALCLTLCDHARVRGALARGREAGQPAAAESIASTSAMVPCIRTAAYSQANRCCNSSIAFGFSARSSSCTARRLVCTTAAIRAVVLFPMPVNSMDHIMGLTAFPSAKGVVASLWALGVISTTFLDIPYCAYLIFPAATQQLAEGCRDERPGLAFRWTLAALPKAAVLPGPTAPFDSAGRGSRPVGRLRGCSGKSGRARC
jgi:hypothetical protein